MTCRFLEDVKFQEQLALLALDMAAEGDLTGCREHVGGCADCRAELDALGDTFAGLGRVVAGVEPPTRLKARVMAAIRGTNNEAGRPWLSWSRETDDGEVSIVRDSDEDWVSTKYEGVEARRLFSDPDADRLTMLIRMQPGSSYPPHVHGGFEECYVLAGELCVGDLRMGRGDYQAAPALSTHVTQSSESGCVLLVSSSFHDELLAGAH